MNPATRLALFNALGLLGLSTLLVIATGGWDLQPSTILLMGTLAIAALVVFWRVSRVYASGRVAVSRAIAEGFVSGAALAVALQAFYWAFVVVTRDASLSTVTNVEGLVNLLQQASFAGAAGAVLGLAIWALNSVALRRSVL